MQQLDLFENKIKNAPKGFVAVEKKYIETANVCDSCDARKLCVTNENNWCRDNSCMSFKRHDGLGVVFQHSH